MDDAELTERIRRAQACAVQGDMDAARAVYAELSGVVERHAAYIRDETLAKSLTVTPVAHATTAAASGTGATDGAYSEPIPAAKLGGHQVVVTVRKA